jgi:methylated-DNA-protein-cysteine methyltransferase related protein
MIRSQINQRGERGSLAKPSAVAAGERASAAAPERIYSAIRSIPAGRVCAYGEVALRAGLPGRARMVGHLLANAVEMYLPWHRVLRANGEIAFAPGSLARKKQEKLLRSEGVLVKNGRVSMRDYALRFSLDEWLFGETSPPR